MVEALPKTSPKWRSEVISAIDCYEKTIEVKNRCIDLPNRPGLGIEINEETAAKYEGTYAY